MTLGRVLKVGDFGLGRTNLNASDTTLNANDVTFSCFSSGPGVSGSNYYDPYSTMITGVRAGGGDGTGYVSQIQLTLDNRMASRRRYFNSWSPWAVYYSSANTTTASDGTLKAASPVVKLFADGSFETNGESEGCTVTRMKAGEYLIEGCMGMNSDAAWGGIDGGFDIPKDRNGQALIWLDYEVNADGSVLVKTFHREYPSAPIFARNSREGFVDGEPADIPADQFVSVRVEMPQNSIWNQRAAMAQVPDSSPD